VIKLNFEDRVVFIAGAGGNLGSSVASKFHSCGANLVLIDYSQEQVQRLFPELIASDQHLIFQGVDVNRRSTIDAIVEKVMDRFGKVDVLVNTIGGYRGGTPIHEMTDETWDLLFNLNARPVFNLARAITPIMKDAKSGKIIHVSARLGMQGSANHSVYSAAKSAVIRITESMAQELKYDGIDTPQNRASRPDADFSHWVSPDAIADVILFLASESARAITGASIPVYGKS
jgi:NAD(P)-dependent dehydrogenase (short-subunit alcohol dehydrogenase family)